MGKQMSCWKDKWVSGEQTGDRKICDHAVYAGLRGHSASFRAIKLLCRRDMGVGVYILLS